MPKCTLPDVEESKQIQGTVHRHGIGSRSRESLPSRRIAAVTSGKNGLLGIAIVISTPTVNVVKRRAFFCEQMRFRLVAQRIIEAPSAPVKGASRRRRS
jgi:hypothetical protein